MTTWPDRRILDLFGIDLPIIQAPMAGSSTAQMAAAVSAAGGLGSMPAALLSPDQLREAVGTIRAATNRSFNLNFFCHQPPVADPARDLAWRAALAPYYVELGLDPAAIPGGPGRSPFNEAYCEVVEETAPAVVSFHFGLPSASLVERVKLAGARVIASATTVAEAVWLEARGCDAIIAMGSEAGGHRGSFLDLDMAGQVGTFALVPQVVDAVSIPVIAAGGIADGRGVAAALVLGASAVQVGTAYLFSPEAKLAPGYREALETARDDNTAITNVFTGRPARGIANRLVREQGPLSPNAPAFPNAAFAVAPLRTAAPADFGNAWSGQAARLAAHLPAGDLTRKLAEEALILLAR
jgi:nitronate monooxygenase